MKRFLSILLSAAMVLGPVESVFADTIFENDIDIQTQLGVDKTEEETREEEAGEEAGDEIEEEIESVFYDSLIYESQSAGITVERESSSGAITGDTEDISEYSSFSKSDEDIALLSSYDNENDWETRTANAHDFGVGSPSGAGMGAGLKTLLRFTPEVDDVYCFYSETLVDEDTQDSFSSDSVGTLYDAYGNMITSDDDSGEGNNFKIVMPLYAGEVYYLEVGAFETDKQMLMLVYVIPNRESETINYSIIQPNGPYLFGDEYFFTIENYYESDIYFEWFKATSIDEYGNPYDYERLEGEYSDTLQFTITEETVGNYLVIMTSRGRIASESFTVEGSTIWYENRISLEVEYNEPVSLFANAWSIYDSPLNYQWYRVNPETYENEVIEGANEAVYVTSSEEYIYPNFYYVCVISDGLYEVSTYYYLTINWFTILENPAYDTVIPHGQDATIGVLVEGVEEDTEHTEITYEWYLDDEFLGQTNVPDYVIDGESLPSPGCTHDVSVIVSIGNFIESFDWEIHTMNTLTCFQAYSGEAAYGIPSVLRVDASTTTDNEIIYTWYKINEFDHYWDYELIAGAYGSQYVTDASDMIFPKCFYYCEVSDGIQTLEFYFYLNIDYLKTNSTGDVYLKSGEEAVLAVFVDEAVTGETYTWYYSDEEGNDEILLADDTGPTLTVNMNEADTDQTFICMVDCGAFTSTTIFNVYSQGTLRTVYNNWNEILESQDIELSVHAFSTRGEDVLTYQWQYGGYGTNSDDIIYTDIAGATSSTYTIPVSEQTSNMLFRCVVSDGYDISFCPFTVCVDPFHCYVTDANGNNLDYSYNVSAAADAEIRVWSSCELEEPIYYQWMVEYNGQLYDIVGAESPVLTFSQEELNDIQQIYPEGKLYVCIITCGSYVSSISIELNVVDIICEQNSLKGFYFQGTTEWLTCNAYSIDGSQLYYQWYLYDLDEGLEVELVDGNSSTYLLNTDSLQVGSNYEFYCRVSTNPEVLGEVYYTEYVTIMSPVLVPECTKYVVPEGSAAFLHADGYSYEGKTLTYQWYQEVDGDLNMITGAKDMVYVVPASSLDQEYSFFACEVSDGTYTSFMGVVVCVVSDTYKLTMNEYNTICYSDKICYLSFTAPEDDTYVFSVSGLDAYVDFDLYLSQGKQASILDESMGVDAHLTAELVAGEVYYLELYAYCDFGSQISIKVNKCEDNVPDTYMHLSAYFTEDVVLDPEFASDEDARYMWYISRRNSDGIENWYPLQGIETPTYTTSWRDIEGNPKVLTDNSACIRGVMLNADGKIIDSQTYVITFKGVEANGSEEYCVIMHQGEEKNFKANVSKCLGSKVSYSWYYSSGLGYGADQDAGCNSDTFTYTMDNPYPFQLKCYVSDGCDSAYVNYWIIPDDFYQITDVSLSILEDGKIGLNYYVTGDEHLYYSFDGGNLLSADEKYSFYDFEYLEGTRGCENYWKYTYRITKVLSSGQMADDVVLNLFYFDVETGELIDLHDSCTYSVTKYANLILGSTEYSEFWPTIKSMINFGTAAQIYFGYNIENLAAELVTNMSSADKLVASLTADELAAYGNVTPEGLEGLDYYGTSLVLADEILIRHYFSVNEGSRIDHFAFISQGMLMTTVKKGNLYYVDIPAGSISYLGDNTVLKIFGVQETCTINYGVRDYIAKAYRNADSEFRALLDTLWFR